MFDYNKPFLLCVDDDPDILEQLKVFLGDQYNIVTAFSGGEALQALKNFKPSIILLDVMMPDMDGYQVCAKLQDNPDTAWIPVIFISALGEEQDRARAFAAGAVDYLVKPINRQTVRELVKIHQHTGQRWQKTKEIVSTGSAETGSYTGSVQEFISDQLELSEDIKKRIVAASDMEIYEAAHEIGLDEIEIARAIALFKHVPYVDFINPDAIKLGSLPAPFSRANKVVVINWQGQDTLVLSNPFDMVLQDSLDAALEPSLQDTMAITDPGNIEMLFEKEPVPYMADRIIALALYNQSKEVRITAGEIQYSIQLHGKSSEDLAVLKWETGLRLISRFKVLAGIAAQDRDKGYDGAYTHFVGKKSCYLRLLLSKTTYGDSMVIQVLDVT